MKTKLSAVVSKVRDELVMLDAERRKNGREALFELSELEIELQFVVEEAGSDKGGFDLKIVSLSSEGQYKEQEVQRVKLTLVAAKSKGEIGPLGSRYRTEKPAGSSREDVEEL